MTLNYITIKWYGEKLHSPHKERRKLYVEVPKEHDAAKKAVDEAHKYMTDVIQNTLANSIFSIGSIRKFYTDPSYIYARITKSLLDVDMMDNKLRYIVISLNYDPHYVPYITFHIRSGKHKYYSHVYRLPDNEYYVLEYILNAYLQGDMWEEPDPNITTNEIKVWRDEFKKDQIREEVIVMALVLRKIQEGLEFAKKLVEIVSSGNKPEDMPKLVIKEQ